MKIIEPRRERMVVGDKSLEAIEAEWRAWNPQSVVQPDEVPAGWITRAQYAAIKGKSASQAQRDISTGRKAGLIETRVFRIASSGKGLAHVPHYRLKG